MLDLFTYSDSQILFTHNNFYMQICNSIFTLKVILR